MLILICFCFCLVKCTDEKRYSCHQYKSQETREKIKKKKIKTDFLNDIFLALVLQGLVQQHFHLRGGRGSGASRSARDAHLPVRRHLFGGGGRGPEDVHGRTHATRKRRARRARARAARKRRHPRPAAAQ